MHFIPSFFSRFRTGILSLCLLLILAACQKEKSLETGNPGGTSTSTFELVPSPTDCSDALVTGTFVVGTAPTPTDMVVISVDVTKTGTWNYNTGKVNGLGFSGSGVFTNTGTQIIALQATGTPTASGSVAFPLNIGTATCSFTVAINDPGGNNPAAGDPYYKATIAGVNYMESVTATNDYEAGSSLGGTDDVSIGASINYSTSPIPAGFTQFGVEKGIMHGYVQATDAQFKAFFALGDHPYAPPAPSDYGNGDGVILSWTDKQGNQWSSGHPTLSQPAGSTFKIISVEDAIDITGTFYIKVKMQFNCTLYKAGTTQSVTLTNGEMLGYFGKI
jgi:hypothetical protein